MPPARSPRLLALAVAAAAVLPVLVAPPASAEEQPSSGDTVVGELVQGYADPAPDEHLAEDHAEDADRLLSWVRTAPGEAVRVDTEDVEDVETGSTVEVVLGDSVVDEAAQEGLEPALQVLSTEVLAAPVEATAPAAGTVNHEVTVVMLHPAGAVRDATSLGQVVDAVNGPVADFWREQSSAAVRLGVVAGHDWTTEATVGCDEPFALWSEAATRAGWTEAPGRHLLVYVPANSPGCGYGLGTIGTGIGSGGMSYVQAPELSVIAHEFGHNLGLGHASELLCERATDSGFCAIDEYYDLYDVMGVSWGPVGSLNAPHAARLGVLPVDSAPTMAAGAPPAQFTLSPAGSRTGTRAVQLVDADGDSYWLEYRTPIGRDSWLGTSENWVGLESGVQVRRATEGHHTSLLLDGTPSALADWGQDLQVALPGAVPVPVGDERFTVSVLQSGPSSARVQVVSSRTGHPIDAAYQRLGGTAVLGAPASAHVCGLRDGGCRRDHVGGAIYWSHATGAHVVRGAILERWRASGAENGPLGYPVGDDVAVPGGFRTDFTGGSIYWSPATGARMVRGAILQRYVAAGGPASLGFPVADDGGTADGTGALVRLQGGVVYWSARTGAHDVRGAILERWRSLGAQTGVLGYPTGDDVAVPGGFKTDFTGGTLYWSASTGPRMVRGAILQRYVAAGGPGVLGHPVVDDGPTPDGKGAFIRLERGEIHWSPSTGANLVSGAVLERWRAVGGQTGSLGAPTGAEVCRVGECVQHFRGGAIYNQVYGNPFGWTGTLVVSGSIAQKWFADGAENGHLGHPANEQRCDLPGGSCAQPFADGWVVTSTPGPARWLSFIGHRGWQENGGAAGRLGHPGNDCRPWDDVGQYCNFEHGVVFVNPSNDSYWIQWNDNA